MNEDKSKIIIEIEKSKAEELNHWWTEKKLKEELLPALRSSARCSLAIARLA